MPPGIFGRVLVYLDIDSFKAINTRFTERVVDRAILPTLHGIVKRSADTLRYAYAEGGDEMIVYLPNATLEVGVAFARALRRLIENHRFQVDEQTVELTASFGVAASETLPGETLAEMANQAKQHAKDSGKNCVAVAGKDGLFIASANFAVPS